MLNVCYGDNFWVTLEGLMTRKALLNGNNQQIR